MPPKRTNYQRKESTRDTRDAQDAYMSFSFRYIRENEPSGNPQSLITWEGDGLLKSLLDSLKQLTERPIPWLLQNEYLAIYEDFPPTSKTDFKCPPNIPHDARWGSIRKIGGQKGRLAGFIIDRVFYIVYFDKDHQFWKSTLRHT